jgi:protein-tyrosine phosphatase
MIDLHSHILRGVDDGAQSLEDSLAIAREAVADGITVIAATPHVRDDFPTDAGVMEYRVAELRDELERQRIPLDVVPGGEVALDFLHVLTLDELRRFGLGGNPRCLLVETPYYGWPPSFADRLFWLLTSGIRPVVAHPERNAEIQSDPERLVRLVDAGVLVQVTAASLEGRIGSRARNCARVLIGKGLAHLLASDAHHGSVRAVGMAAAVRSLGNHALGDWMTWDVPSAILSDTELPPRPPGGARGGWLGKLLGT